MTRHFALVAGILALVAVPQAQAGIIYSNNFNSNGGGLNNSTGSGLQWTYSSGLGAWRINSSSDPLSRGLQSAQMVVTGGGLVTISFDHYRNFENQNSSVGYDGGQLLVSVNSGAYTLVPLSDFSSNGYTHTISNSYSSPIGGQRAFSGSTSGFVTSVATLGNLNDGDTISFKFLAAWDNSVTEDNPNWVIDNVLVQNSPTGVVVPAPPTLLLGIVGIGLTGVARWRRLRKVA